MQVVATIRISLQTIKSVPVAFLATFLLLHAVCGHAQAAGSADVLKDIPYHQTARANDRRQTLDLYLPKGGVRPWPLLIFVHGGYWSESDDDYRLGPSLAQSLIDEGIAVALVRYRLAPAHRHPDQVEDVAAAVAFIIENHARHGIDAKRIFLAGHSAGGHLAALVALDPRYLRKHRLEPNQIAGVIGFSGIYNLIPNYLTIKRQNGIVRQVFGNSTALLQRASPIHYARGGVAPFLVISAARDFPGFALDSRRFADALRRAGSRTVQQYMVGGADHFSIVDLRAAGNPIRRAIVDFMGLRPLPAALKEWTRARQQWADPPYSTEPFWKFKQLLRSYPADDRFIRRISFAFGKRKEELAEWALRKFHAIDLFAFLAARPTTAVGAGKFIVLKNIRGEQQVWHEDEITPFMPVIVVGIDGQRDLFRVTTFYNMHRQYSWKPGRRSPLLALSAGAFVHFLKPPPRALAPQSWHFGFTLDSFTRVNDDPLKRFRSLGKDLLATLTYRNGCVFCHRFQGVGARSHHVHALSAQPYGGFALPLEQYPAKVWEDFVFNQEKVARKMGANPNVVLDSVRQQLFEMVRRSRGQPKP